MVDGEWHLRRWGEDELCTGADLALERRARVLTAIGAVTAERADAVVRQYQRAARLRGRYQAREWTGHPVAPSHGTVVLAAGRTLELPWGTVVVHHVRTDQNRTAVRVTISRHPGASVPWLHSGPSRRHGPPDTQITDDRGTKYLADFSGSGGDTGWDGSLSISPPVRSDARWLTLFGERVDLDTRPPVLLVALHTVEQAADVAERATRYLVHLADALDWGRDEHDPIQVAADAIVGSEILPADADVLAQVRAARHAGRMLSPGQRAWTLHAMMSAVHNAPAPVPPPWRARAASRIGRTDGRIGTQFLGVTIADLDGIGLSIMDLRSTETDVGVWIECSGPVPSVVVAADDDLGNRYLGTLGGWEGGSEGVAGTVTFGAPLDPDATLLELQVSTFTTRATVQIPLDRAER